jgi:hypothetical protein
MIEKCAKGASLPGIYGHVHGKMVDKHIKNQWI